MEKFASLDQWEASAKSLGYTITKDNRSGTYIAWKGNERKGEYVTHSSAGAKGGRLSNSSNSFQNGVHKAQTEIQNKLDKVGVKLENGKSIYDPDTWDLIKAVEKDHMTREIPEAYVMWDVKSKRVVMVPK